MARPKDKAKARYSIKIKKLSNIHRNWTIIHLKRQEMLSTYSALNGMEAQGIFSNIDIFRIFLKYRSDASVLPSKHYFKNAQIKFKHSSTLEVF